MRGNTYTQQSSKHIFFFYIIDNIRNTLYKQKVLTNLEHVLQENLTSSNIIHEEGKKKVKGRGGYTSNRGKEERAYRNRKGDMNMESDAVNIGERGWYQTTFITLNYMLKINKVK